MEPLVRFGWAIKNILRHKANFDILEGFLSALFKEEIRVLNLLESESNREREADKLSPEERRAYDDFLQNLSYQASMERSRWMDGWVAGKAEGAKNLLAQGIDHVVIMAATGLNLEQLQQLAQENSS